MAAAEDARVLDPLHGCRARLDRARKHVDDLQPVVRQFRDDYRERSLAAHYDPHTGQYAYQGEEIDVPDRISVIAGDAIYSLRCALDYLIYALAEFDSGEPQEQTQFPITDSETKFAGAIKAGRLRGLSDVHVAAIEALQPYDGRDSLQWLRVFREVANPDKHRHLNALTVIVSTRLKRGEWDHVSIFQLHHRAKRWDLGRQRKPLRSVTKAEPGVPIVSGRGRAPHHPAGNMGVKLDVSADVAFVQGPEVVEALELFQTEARALIDAFEPEFKR